MHRRRIATQDNKSPTRGRVADKLTSKLVEIKITRTDGSVEIINPNPAPEQKLKHGDNDG